MSIGDDRHWEVVLNEIKVSAVCYVTEKELFHRSKEDILKDTTGYLARILACHILNKTGVFETEKVKGGLRIMAECYVLTPNDFSELVEKIQRDLQHFGPPATIGGVSS